MEYPKEYVENLAWRQKLLLRCKEDSGYRELVRELFFKDLLFAFNAFFFTFDVRRRPNHHLPFCTYPYQDETILDLVEALTQGEDRVLEKSRDMGLSWLVILVFLWFWLNPKGGADFLLGSRIEDYVDRKGDMRTLLQKARYALYRLPKFLWPAGFNKQKNDNFMKLENPESGATITGESNNPNFSTGGRYLGVLFDEFAKWEVTDNSAWTAAGDATPCRIAVSTAFGAAGKFYDLVTDGKTKKVRLDWWLHPMKAEGLYCPWPKAPDDEDGQVRSIWYDMETARRTPLEMAQEVDINYIGAGNPVFDGKAMKRVLKLLKSEKKASAWYRPDLGTMELTPVVEPRENDGYLVVWEPPEARFSYTMGVDVAEGKELGDFSVVKVICRERWSLVASYFSRLDEVQLAAVISLVHQKYGGWVGIEVNGPGLATFDLCVEKHDLTDLFMMPRYDVTKEQVVYKKGWRTDANSRNMLISGIREWLIAGQGWVDSRCLRELTTFVRGKTGKAQAKEGCFDDEVIAFGIALQVHELSPTRDVEVGRRKELPSLLPEVFDMEALKIEGKILSLQERCAKDAEEKREERELMMEAVRAGWVDASFEATLGLFMGGG